RLSDLSPLRHRDRARRGARALVAPGGHAPGRHDPRRRGRRRDGARHGRERRAPVHRGVRVRRVPGRARRHHRRALRRRLSGRRLRDPRDGASRRHHRRARQPQGRLRRRPRGRPPRQLRQGVVSRARAVHGGRADGRHPRAAAHGSVRGAVKALVAGGAVALVLLVALPAVLSSYQLSLLTKMLIFGIFAMSLDLLLGYAGLPSLGHAAYFGVAAYTVGLLALRVANNFWIDFPAGLLMAAGASSPFGLGLVGIRESERRMEVLGYDVWRYKYVAFILAGLFAGLAGTLFVYFNGFVSPSYLNIVFSASALLMVILGGAGTLLGP